jgi:hypothetical protein
MQKRTQLLRMTKQRAMLFLPLPGGSRKKPRFARCLAARLHLARR